MLRKEKGIENVRAREREREVENEEQGKKKF